MLCDSRLFKTWHISQQQRSPFPLKRLPVDVLNDIATYLCPADVICLRLACRQFVSLPSPIFYELTKEDKTAMLDSIKDINERTKTRRLLKKACMINGDVIEKWRIPGYLNEQRQTAQRRYEHDCGRAKKTLPLLFCNKCGKLKKAYHTTGFADTSSGLTVSAIRNRECIPCRIGRFDNLRVASIYRPIVNGLEMFSCFLCREARPFEEDGLKLWQSLAVEELERHLVRGVALVEHKFCKRCFDLKEALNLKDVIQEVDYTRLIKMMERMFPTMGKLDAKSVENEECSRAEKAQKQFQDKLMRQANEAADKERGEQERKNSEMALVKETMDLEGLDWSEDLQDVTSSPQVNSLSPVPSISAEDHHKQPVSNTDVNVQQSRTDIETAPPTTPSPRVRAEFLPNKSNILSSPPTLPNNDSDDDVFGEAINCEDITLSQHFATPPSSDDVIMSGVPGVKAFEDDKEYGSDVDMADIETLSHLSVVTPDPAPAAPGAQLEPTSTGDWDRYMFGGNL